MSAYTDDPQTRVEAILQNILGKNNLLQPPQTRVEELLLLILNQGLGGVTYKGVTTTELTDGSTTNPIVIDGNEVEAQTGDFVAYGGKEFVWNGESWQELGDLELVVAVMSSIAPQYISTETYNTGDRVYQDNVLYECDDDNVTGEFNPLKWHQVTITQILAEIDNNIQSIFGMISDTYDPDETYNIGRLVIHNKKLYKCNTDGTTGTWNSAKWDETSIAYELENATPVEANPVEDATAELNKLKIFDDVYSVGNAHFRPIKQVEYDALSESEQKNGTIYFIYDAPALEVTANPEDDPEQPLVKLSIDGVIYYIPAELPEVTAEDNGKILKVVDGAWVAATEVDPTSIIDDTTTASNKVWSSSKIEEEFDDRSVTKTATGNPIELTDAANAPLVKCTTEIQGSQDLHGYDKPWVGGAGKNKIGYLCARETNGITFAYDQTSGAVTITGTATAQAIEDISSNYANYTKVSFGTYKITGAIDGYNGKLQVWGVNESGQDITSTIDVTTDNTEITMPESGYLFVRYVIYNTRAVNITVYPMARLSTVQDSTFAPYSNICPITAYTEGEIEVSDGDGNTTTHTTTYPSAIYRGSEDVVNGEVTSDMPMIDLGDLTWSYNSTLKTFYTNLSDAKGYTKSQIASAISSAFSCVANNSIENDLTLDGVFSIHRTGTSNWLNVRYLAYTSTSDFTTAVTGFNLAYELENSTTASITVSNAPVKSLSGYNHIESSTGDMEVEYITENYQPLVDLIESNKHVYSTQEQIVGTWIDGSTVYERTISTALVTGSAQTVQTGISNADKIVYVDGKIIDANGINLIPHGFLGQVPQYSWILYDVGRTDFKYNASTYLSGTVYVTLRYTKSTTTRSLSAPVTSQKAQIEPLTAKEEEVPTEEEKAVNEEENTNENR